MSESSTAKKSTNAIRVVLGIGGLVAVVLGILVLVWPLKTAAIITILIAIYAVVAGLVYLGLGIFSKGLGAWARIGHIVLGALFIAAGIIAFLNPGDATLILAFIVTIFIGVSWIVEGIVALTLLGQVASKGWTIFYAIISIIAGIFILLAPLWAAALLWLFLGIALIVLGIVQVIRAFTYKGGSFGAAVAY
ncbi:MAG TPA: DUF308 domain-containing protein [Microbacteriaceae bacterium]|nr:DUF308 domain-containing protein [Microbacteriaceae bacterium]